MIPTAASSGSPAGLTVRVADVPVRVRWMFPALIAFLGWYPGVTPFRLFLWFVVASGAVLWHELGHAFAARRLGASPSIELYGFGGATSWQPPEEPSRRQLIGVSFAGPFAGFLVGGLTLLGVALAGTTGTGDVRYLVLILLWTNIGWGLVNLLPVLPLDGGHILAELFPGDRATRTRRAALVSVVVASVAIVAVVAIGAVFAAFILGWIVLANLSTVTQGRSAEKREAVETEAIAALRRLGHHDPDALADIERLLLHLGDRSPAFRSVAIETAAATGDAAGARRLLDGSRREPLAPGVYSLVFAAESSGRDGVDELIEIFRREPSAVHARWLAVALQIGRRIDELPAVLASPTVPIDPAAYAEAAAVADGFGAPDTAHAVRALEKHPPPTSN